ncbi:MAG: hypothetical protein J7L45_00730 [Candidatus Aenigmarchaeota archaeon]|nr:hypothetical protein [Candidatus Aenigmarchaeota archaeon]
MKIKPGDIVLFNPFGISPPYEEVGEILAVEDETIYIMSNREVYRRYSKNIQVL